MKPDIRQYSSCYQSKVQLSLCLTNYHTTKTYRGMKVDPCAFLISVLDGGDWSALCPSYFTPGVKAPHTKGIWGWMGPRASLDRVAKRKSTCLWQKFNPSSSPQSSHCTDWAIPASWAK